MSTDVFSEGQARYEAACERLSQLYDEWHGLGRPTTTGGSMGQLVEHPLMKMMRDLEATCDRLAASLRRRHRGPVPSAVEDGGSLRPAGKLRAVR